MLMAHATVLLICSKTACSRGALTYATSTVSNARLATTDSFFLVTLIFDLITPSNELEWFMEYEI